MAFKKPVQWIENTGLADFDMAMRYFVSTPTLSAMDKSSKQIKSKRVDFSPAYFEIYCEGAGDKKLGGKRNYDLIAVFFKNLFFDKKGKDLPKVKTSGATDTFKDQKSARPYQKHFIDTKRFTRIVLLFPKATLTTPNLPAAKLFSIEITRKIHKRIFINLETTRIYFIAPLVLIRVDQLLELRDTCVRNKLLKIADFSRRKNRKKSAAHSSCTLLRGGNPNPAKSE